MTDNQAHARSTDPETSHMAADGVDVARFQKLNAPQFGTEAV